GVGAADLAGIDDVPPVAEAAVERVEAEPGIGRVVEGSDDAGLYARREVGAEAHADHAGDERGVVAAVAFEARGRSALRLELVEGTREGEQRVGGRRVAELPVPVEAPELAEEVEAEGAAPALGGLEIRAPREDE